MKRSCVILACVTAVLAWRTSQADEWWRGTSGPEPPSVNGVPVGPSSHTGPTASEREPRAPRPERPVVYELTPQQKREAKKRAERAEAIRRDLRRQIVRMGDAPAVDSPSSSVPVRPGTSFFGIPSNPGVALAAPLSGVQTLGTRVPIEALRRAVAILQHAMSGQSDEDMAFCAGEAAKAMEGADTQVVVVDLSSSGTDERTREFGALVENLQQKRAAVEVARSERVALENTMNDIARQLKREGADRPMLETRLFAEYGRYQEVEETERKAKEEVEELVGDLVSWGDGSAATGEEPPSGDAPIPQQ